MLQPICRTGSPPKSEDLTANSSHDSRQDGRGPRRAAVPSGESVRHKQRSWHARRAERAAAPRQLRLRKSAPPRSPRKKSRSSESRCTDGELPFAGRASALPDRRATERGARGAHATRAGRSGRRIPPAAAQKVRPASPAEHKSRSRRKVDAAGHPRRAAGRDAAPGAPRECARHGPSVPQRPAEESARDVHAPPPARRQKVITCAPGILATIGQRKRWLFGAQDVPAWPHKLTAIDESRDEKVSRQTIDPIGHATCRAHERAAVNDGATTVATQRLGEAA